MDSTARAPRLPSPIIASTWWAGRENSPITDDGETADPTSSSSIRAIPTAVNAVRPSSTPRPAQSTVRYRPKMEL
jgi:hypothetical protein